MDHAKTLITHLPWRLVYGGYLLQHRIYRHVHRLQAVGELIYLGRTCYRGPSKVLSDRTRINPGDPLGIIHFDNHRLAKIEHQPGSVGHRAIVFRRLLYCSLVTLAQRVQTDSELKDIAAFRGITWMPTGGRLFGFEAEPLPSGLRARWLQLHFRLMLHAFYPEGAAGRVGQPFIYWLTRRQLLDRHAPDPVPEKNKRISVH
ncbi:MAG TPA: hypothetical protein VHJ19_04545 [Gammaproteobacteria bacterium]|nr:hypothetical protein [Gammaproteobacteria bacterium]